MRFKSFITQIKSEDQLSLQLTEQVHVKAQVKDISKLVKDYGFMLPPDMTDFKGDFEVYDNPRAGKGQDAYKMRLVGRSGGKHVEVDLGSHPNLDGAKAWGKIHTKAETGVSPTAVSLKDPYSKKMHEDTTPKMTKDHEKVKKFIMATSKYMTPKEAIKNSGMSHDKWCEEIDKILDVSKGLTAAMFKLGQIDLD